MERIRMTFTCDQEWEAMRPTACGRFCTVCSKEVHDLTRKSFAEIEQLKSEKGAICGMFTAEQVEPSLVAFEFSLIKKMRCYAVAFAAVIGIETAHADTKGAGKAGIVMVQTPGIDRDNPGPGDHPTGRDSRKKKKIKLSKKSTDEPVKVKKKKKIYFSKRFPFIHRRRMRIVGKF